MKTSLNVDIFGHGTPIDQMITKTARAGFDAVELAVTCDGPLTFESAQAECVQIAKLAGREGLEVSAITVEDCRDVNLAASEPALRKAAYQRIVTALDLAAWLGTDTVIIAPAVVGEPTSPQPEALYEDAYTLALEALLALRFEGEQRAVHIACMGCRNRFLLSPLEMRDFIDRINSFWVSVSLNPANVLPWGYPEDWIRTLGHRIIRVHFDDVSLGVAGQGEFRPLGDGDVNWSEVMTALRQVPYAGPATCRGRGNPSDAAARLAQMLRSAD